LKRDDHNLEPLDAILRRATAQPPGPPTPECADPETLAAYYDRSLAEADRDRLEAHFADCARCQAQLAAIARADEAGASARPHREISWLRPLIVVPAIAAAAALLVVVRSMRSSNDEFRRSEQVAMATHQAPLMDLAARAPAPASPPSAANPSSAPSSNELAMNEPKLAEPSAPQNRQEPERRDELRTNRMSPAKESRLRKSEGEVIASAPNRNATGNVASTEAAPASVQPPVSAPVQSSSVETMAAPSVEPGPTAPAPYPMSQSAAPRALAGAASGAVAGSAIGAGAGNAQLRMSEQRTTPSADQAYGSNADVVGGASAGAEVLVTTTSLDRSTTWIVGKNGMILRRDKDGSNHPQHSGVTTDLTAGAAPSSTVCWIVGRSGTIIRTTDGEHWTLITAPTGDNLVAVASDSADHAVVTTASGQNFATSDGGKSWHRQ
jgi:hypothetical protein